MTGTKSLNFDSRRMTKGLRYRKKKELKRRKKQENEEERKIWIKEKCQKDSDIGIKRN